MSGHRTPRTSDRLLTPGVVVVALLMGGGCLALVIASVTYLAAQGLDPDPMLRLVAEATGAVGVLINLMLTIGGRAGVAKVERTTGRDLPAKVDDVATELGLLAKKVDAALWIDSQQQPQQLEDDHTRPHPLVATRAAPAARRE